MRTQSLTVIAAVAIAGCGSLSRNNPGEEHPQFGDYQRIDLVESCEDGPNDCGWTYTRGDVNDDDAIDITDANVLLEYLYLGGTKPCLQASDVNADGSVDMADPIHLLNYLFLGQEPPAGAFPENEMSCALLDGVPGPDLAAFGHGAGGDGAGASFDYTSTDDTDDSYGDASYGDSWGSGDTGWEEECYWDDAELPPFQLDDEVSYYNVNVHLVNDDGAGDCDCAYEIKADLGPDDTRGYALVALVLDTCSNMDDGGDPYVEFGISGGVFTHPRSVAEIWADDDEDYGVNETTQWESLDYVGALDECPDCLAVGLYVWTDNSDGWVELTYGEYDCIEGCESAGDVQSMITAQH